MHSWFVNEIESHTSSRVGEIKSGRFFSVWIELYVTDISMAINMNIISLFICELSVL